MTTFPTQVPLFDGLSQTCYVTLDLDARMRALAEKHGFVVWGRLSHDDTGAVPEAGSMTKTIISSLGATLKVTIRFAEA